MKTRFKIIAFVKYEFTHKHTGYLKRPEITCAISRSKTRNFKRCSIKFHYDAGTQLNDTGTKDLNDTKDLDHLGLDAWLFLFFVKQDYLLSKPDFLFG